MTTQPSQLFGYHIKDINKKYDVAIQKAFEEKHDDDNNLGAFQIFLKSPMKISNLNIDEKVIQNTFDFVKKNNIFLVAHSIYLINLAKNKKIDIKMAVDDMNMIVKMGGVGVVFHLGKDSLKNEKKSMENMKSFIKNVIDESDEKSFFIIETAAGTGTQLCVKIEEMFELYNTFSEKYKKRIRFCIDTCHIFSAGYQIKKYINTFVKLFGIDNLLLFHLNDSKEICGSKKDRHESITFGKIWGNEKDCKSLQWLVKFSKKNKIPMILETPTKTKKDCENRKKEISIILKKF
jgi:deoxyribonuclease-4